MSDTVYDVPDLKEKIRRLRATKTGLEEERKQLEADCAQFESHFSSLRQELNIIGNVDKLQVNARDDFTEDSNPEAMKKFRLMNEKLEMKILIQEIRAALPQLEKEAKSWEAKARGDVLSSSRNEKTQQQFPSMILKSADELQEQIGTVLEEKFKIKSNISHDIATKKKEKLDICTEIASLRRRLSMLEEEVAPLQIAHLRLKMALLSVPSALQQRGDAED